MTKAYHIYKITTAHAIITFQINMAPYVFEDTAGPRHSAALGAFVVICTVKVHVVIPSFVSFIVVTKPTTVHLQEQEQLIYNNRGDNYEIAKIH